MKDIKEIEEIIKSKLSEKRYYHSKCVQKRCIELAKIYNVDEEKASLVGIAHDIAKEMTKDEKLEYVRKNNIEIDEIEEKNTELLHSKIGAHIAKTQFRFTDDMVKAIENHTTGNENMDMLSKILFISDATGEDRTWEGKEEIVDLSKKDIDKAILYCIKFTVKDVLEKNRKIHLNTIKTWNYYV